MSGWHWTDAGRLFDGRARLGCGTKRSETGRNAPPLVRVKSTAYKYGRLSLRSLLPSWRTTGRE